MCLSMKTHFLIFSGFQMAGGVFSEAVGISPGLSRASAAGQTLKGDYQGTWEYALKAQYLESDKQQDFRLL